MDDLLETAVTAHGGLDRWNQITSITVDASIGGDFWSFKNQSDALKQIRFEVETTRQRLTMEFHGQDKRSVFVPTASRYSAATGSSLRRVTTLRRPLTVMSSILRGTTSTSPISPAKPCGRI